MQPRDDGIHPSPVTGPHRSADPLSSAMTFPKTTSASASTPSANRQRVKKGNIDQTPNDQILQNGTAASSNPTFAISTTTSILQIWAPTLVLIFGGCCSNVYTLESLIHTSHSSGPLITAFQFLLVALATLPHHLSISRGWRNLYLRERAIPLRKWVIYTAYFLSVNILNNMAFKYRISIPLHIILRSAGPVTTMAVGRIWGGKRYSAQKVIAVFLLFGGVVLAAIADAQAKQAEPEYQAVTDFQTASSRPMLVSAIASQGPGFALLASALLLSACMGLYTDDMYSAHGRSGAITSETLFYSHAMSLPFFASQAKPLLKEFANVTAAAVASASPATSTSSWFDPRATNATSQAELTSFVAPFIQQHASPLYETYFPVSIHIPRPVVLLFLNATTQLLCIVGVNRLSAQSTSLTVSIVLNIRKLASLLLSIWLFGNQLPLGVMVGAAIVFVGGGLYAVPTRGGGRGLVDKKRR